MGTRALCADGKRRLCDDGKRPKGCTFYRQARNCTGNALIDVWMTEEDAAEFPDAFVLNAIVDDACAGYYFDPEDAATTTHGTLYDAEDAVARDDCSGAIADPLACEKRVACSSYIVAGHIYLENGVGDEWEMDYSDTWTASGCQLTPPGGHIQVPRTVQATGDQDAAVDLRFGLTCTAEWIEGRITNITPNDWVRCSRDRQTTIEGSYPTASDSFNPPWVLTLSGFSITCDDAP